ncbi:MAG: potassium-transporting ATPase subunit KdpC [Firmicutes bacterium]|nr:potassium-transporting ATPase subunit KdpC [Bacillota bacterium]
MGRYLKTGLIMLVVMTLVLGIVYPLVVYGLAQVLFPQQANGSLVIQNGQPVGSALIGQGFQDPRYFHGRPSAAGSDGYDASASAGSNLGPTNQKLIEGIAGNATAVREENGLSLGASVPADLVTASGSGLDPHISPTSAQLQVPRVAKVRNLPSEKVYSLVDQYTEAPQLGLLGEPRVNVLFLNLALDEMK